MPTVNPLDLIVGLFTAPNINQLPKDAFYADAKKTETAYTAAVEFLRSEFPHDVLRRFGARLWQCVESRQTPVAIYEAVASLHFFALVPEEGPRQAAILAPRGWTDKAKKDPIGQMGGIIWSGSQAIDFCNNKMKGPADPEMMNRAKAYETEFLLRTQELAPEWRPTSDYQEHLLATFPQGIKTPSVASIIYPL